MPQEIGTVEWSATGSDAPLPETPLVSHGTVMEALYRLSAVPHQSTIRPKFGWMLKLSCAAEEEGHTTVGSNDGEAPEG
jgi:hypothetical protein